MIGDFNGDGRADVMMQPLSSNGTNYLLFGNAQGPIFSSPNGALPSNVAVSLDAAQLVVGKFSGGTMAGVLIQSRSSSGTNSVASNIGNGIVGNSVVLPSPNPASVTGSNSVAPATTPGSAGGPATQSVQAMQAAATLTPTSAGRTPGQFGVSAVGAATYDFPIWTPPGARKLEPHLALHYTSGGADGLLGPGWALSGMSMITRCGKTWASSGGSPAAVALVTTDDLCLDGNRLRLTGGTQGVAGSTYQTELANFSNVTAYGAQGNGPQYFLVQGKDGRTYEYGNTADSRLYGSGATTPYAWALNKIRDRQTNNMTFSYTPTAGVAPTLIKIQYTAIPATSTAAPYEVDFNYVTRVGGASYHSERGGSGRHTNTTARQH